MTSANIILKEIAHFTNGEFIVLRGYQDLPETINNDLDIALKTSQDLKTLREGLNDAGYKIVHRMRRLGVLKMSVLINDDWIDLDVWTDINFLGLKYVNFECLFRESKMLEDFRIPSPECELRISLFKEVLHMKRVREDKLEHNKLLFQLLKENCFFYSVYRSLLYEGYSSRLRNEISKTILLHNINHSIPGSVVRVTSFIRIRLYEEIIGYWR
jgi:hypothetical protein